MNLTSLPRQRSDQIDYVSSELFGHAALLNRLLVAELGGELSRTELGVLATLSRRGPRRITELAELERLAQPTMTLLVKRLEQQGLLERERHAGDGRVVLVSLTAVGAAVLEDYRAQASAVLSAELAELPDAEVEALAVATRTLEQLIAHLQDRTRAPL